MGGHSFFSRSSKQVPHLRAAGRARPGPPVKKSHRNEGSNNLLGQDDIRSSPPHPLSTLALLPHSRPCRGGELGQSKASGAPRLAVEAMEGRARVAEQD